MGSLSNMEGAGRAEKVTLRSEQLCPTCGQPVPQAGARAQPEWEPPEQIKVLEARLHEQLTERFPDFKYHIWLRPLRLLWRERDHLTFAAPAHIRTSFEERYLGVVVGLLREAGWGNVTGEVVDEAWRPSAEQLAAGVKGAPPPAGAVAPAQPPPVKRGPIANAPAKAMERTAEALSEVAKAAGNEALAEELGQAAEVARQAQARPAEPKRRRRSDVP